MTGSYQHRVARADPVEVDDREPDHAVEPFFPVLAARLAQLREAWSRGWRPSPFDVAAGAILTVQFVVAAYVVVPGSFYLDDLRLQSIASHGLTWGFLFSSEIFTHFAPGQHLLVWLQAVIAPLNHAVGACLQLGLQLLASVLMYRLVRRMWGPKRLALIPFAFYALSPMLLPIDGWWSQSVSLLPVHAAIIGTALAHLRYLQTGEQRWGRVGVLAYAVGLLFWEMGVLALLLVALVTLLYYPTGRGRAAFGATLKCHSGLSAAYAAVTVAYAAIYVTRNYSHGGTHVTAVNVLHMLGNQIGRAFLPSLLGGPWRWQTTASYFGIASPTIATVVVAAVAVALLVVTTVRHAWRAWTLLVVCFVANFVMVAYGRLALFGPNVGLDYRYASVLAVPTALAAGLAVLPAPIGSTRGPGPHARLRLDRVQPAALYTAVAVLVLSTTVSAASFGRAWHRNPVGAFVANAAGDLHTRHGRVNLYDTIVPGDVLPGFFYPWNTVSHVLAPITGKSTTFNDGSQFFMLVDRDGHIVGTHLAGAIHNLPGPSGKCGYAVTPATRLARIPLDGALPRLENTTMRVEFIVAAPTTARLSMGEKAAQTPVSETPRPLRLTRGLQALVVQAPQQLRVSDVVVGPFTPPVFVCVTSVTVGIPEPIRLPVRKTP